MWGIFILLFSMLLSNNLISQIYLTEDWVQTSGIPDTVDYSACKVDGSGNVYVTTNTISATEKANILTTKYNSSGVVQWQVEKDNADENDYGSAIEVDGSGNVYVGAATWVDGTNKYDYLVIKYNSSGTQQWTATYNGAGNFYDIPTDILVDGSGNVYVTGASYGSGTLSDFCTIKYNSSGTTQWNSRYDYSSDQDIAAIIKEAPSGRIYIVGASENAPGVWDFAAIKYNQSTGAQLAVNRNSASGSGFDQVFSADVDASGNIYLAGRASVVDEGFNLRTVKIDTALSVVWARNRDFALLDDEAHGVVVDLDNNVYVTGWVTNADGTKSFETLKYNSSGTLQWHQEESSPNGGLDTYALKISSVTDGNIVVAGNIDNGASLDFLTVIYNEDGDRLWMEQYDSPNKDDDKVNYVKADVDGVFYVGGKSYSISTSTNRLIKYTANSYIVPPDDDMEHPTSLTFFENKGQIIDTDDELREDIKYYTHRQTPSLYFTDDVISYVWSSIDTTTADDTLARVDLSFIGSNGSKEIHRATSQGGEYLNYYLAHCPDGVTNARSSDRLVLNDLYANVDLEYYFDGAGLKYYLIIKPGWSEQNDPIHLLYDGADEVNILVGGELEIKNSIGTLIQAIPEAYQIDIDGDRIDLLWDADYLALDDFEIGFDIDSYDDELPLIIEIKMDGMIGGGDCEDNVIWGTWYGGGEEDIFSDVKWNFDLFGTSIYVAGISFSINFPDELNYTNDLSSSLFDNIIQKFAYDRDDLIPTIDNYEPLWATYLGGTGNEGWNGIQQGPKITFIGGQQKIVFVGATNSTDLPTMDYNTGNPDDLYDSDINSFMDGTAGIVSTFGELKWLTYIGGSTGISAMLNVAAYTNYPDYGFVIVGFSQGGTDFPYFDPGGGTPYYASGRGGCIIELNENLELKWGTLFGGSSIYERIYDVEINDKGDYYFTGISNTTNLPTTIGAFQTSSGGGQDAFIAKITPIDEVRSLEWCTYYGGEGNEVSVALAIDNDRNIYATGITYDPMEDLPLYCGGCNYFDYEYTGDDALDRKGFIIEFGEDGTRKWATYIGGKNHTYPYDIASDGSNIVVTGYLYDEENEFPLQSFTDVYFDNTDENLNTTFLALFDKTTALNWSTFLGDDAFSRSTAATFGNNSDEIAELYIVGNVSYTIDENSFKPLCDPGGNGYYQNDPYSTPSTGLNIDGYIVGFDISMFDFLYTSIPENLVDVNSYIAIFPNPANKNINIKVATPEYYQVEFYNLLGEHVLTFPTQYFSSLELDISILTSGVYNVQLNSLQNRFHGKFVKF